MDVEVADGILNGIEGITLIEIPKGKKPMPKATVWELPLEDGMEVEPNIVVLGVTKDIEIVPSPCTDT